jgi:hypothetical protein
VLLSTRDTRCKLAWLVGRWLCTGRCRKRAAFELVDSQRLRFEDHGLRDNVALLTLLQPRRQQEAPAGQPRQEKVSANGGAAAADGAAANGAPAGQQNGISSAGPAATAAAGNGVAAAGSGGGLPLLFGNTHILFNPKRGDIKVRSKTQKLRRPLACGNVQTPALVHAGAAYLASPLCVFSGSTASTSRSNVARIYRTRAAPKAVTPETTRTLTLACVTVCWR